MAKVATERLFFRHGDETIDFKYDINVSVDGLFSTTLPGNIVEMLKEANIDLKFNRANRLGYFSSDNMDYLKKKVRDIIEEYFSRELIDERQMIAYAIETTCTYCLDVEGKVVPNASSEWTKFKERPANDWKEGTKHQNAVKRRPFGIEIYAKPIIRRTYRYKSGATKIEDEEATAFGGGTLEKSGNNYYARFLEGLTSICPPEECEMQYIDYTEEVAKVFVDMIIDICNINEKIKSFITPEGIALIAKQNLSLMQATNQQL